MKKSIIITLLAVGGVIAYLFINPPEDEKEDAHTAQNDIPPRTSDSILTETVDLPNPSLSNESDTALLTKEATRDQARSSLEKSMRDQVTSALEISDPDERHYRITEILKHLSPENWHGALNGFQEYSEEFPKEWNFFVRLTGEVVGREAMLYFYGTQKDGACRICLQGWAKSNPDEAFKWLKTESDPRTRKEIGGAVMRGAAVSNPNLAVEMLEQIPVEIRHQYTRNFVKTLIRAHGIEATEQLFLTIVGRAEANNEIDRQYLIDIFDDLAMETIPDMLLNGEAGLDDATEWLEAHMGHSYVNNALSYTVNMLAWRDGRSAIAWLDSNFSQHPNQKSRGYAAAIDAWTKVEGVNVIGSWLNDNTDHPAYDELASAHVRNVFKKDPESAASWINTISNEKLRSQLIKTVLFKKKIRR